jgi:hypothetical protein
VVQYISSKEPTELDQTDKKEDDDDDGFDDAFQFLDEFQDIITSGTWVSNDCFVYTNHKGQIYYMIGSKPLKFANVDKK